MTFSWDPSDYEKNSSAQFAWARELIDALALQRDDRVLDIGCGDGKVTAELAGRVSDGRCVGIDSSAAMVGLARSRFPRSRYPNLEFEEADASALRYQGEFTAVFSNAALHWVRDHGPVLQGISRSLRPRGRVLLQMGGEGNAAEIVRAFDEVCARADWREHFEGFEFRYGFYGCEEYRGWLCDAGLDPGRVELIGKDMVHDGRNALEGWIRTTWIPWTERVPEASRQRFVTEVVARYQERHPVDEEGRTHVHMVRLEVGATKPESTT